MRIHVAVLATQLSRQWIAQSPSATHSTDDPGPTSTLQLPLFEHTAWESSEHRKVQLPEPAKSQESHPNPHRPRFFARRSCYRRVIERVV